MASIYVYRNILHMNIRENGKQYRKSTGLKNTKENKVKVQEEILPLFITNISGPSTDVNVEYYANRYLEEKKHICKERTYTRYKQFVEKWIIPTYGKRKILTIKASVVKDFINTQYELGKTAKSLELYITIFRGVLQEAVYDGILLGNPFQSIRRKKKKKPIVTPFSKAEVQLLLANSSGWFHNYIGIATHTVMRSG